MSAEIHQLADLLRQMAHAPRERWSALSHQIEQLRVVALGQPADPSVQMLASVGKSFARQMPHADPVNETDMRGIAVAFANVLQNALALTTRERDRRHYVRTDR